MKSYPMLEKKPEKALFTLFLFAMLLLARDTLVTSCLLGFTKSQLLMLVLMGLYGLWFLARNLGSWKELLTDRRWLLILACCAVFLVPMAVKRDWQMMYFSMLLCLVFAIFVSFFADVGQVSRIYIGLMTLLGLYSVLASYGLKALATQGLIRPKIFFNDSGWDFYNFGLCYAVTWTTWFRNFGIFREPGVYQFFLILGLYLNNYQAQWNRPAVTWAVNAALAVTLLTTFAAGGLIELGLLAVFLYFDKGYFRTRWGKWLGLGCFAAAAGAVGFVVWRVNQPGIENTVFYEFYDVYLRLTTKSASLVDRLSSIFLNLTYFFQKPLFGDTLVNVLHGTSHNTSSTLILFASLGILGGALHVAGWAALLWEKKRGVFGNLFLMMILFMSFNTQNLVADVFFWLFPMLALTQKGLACLPERRREIHG